MGFSELIEKRYSVRNYLDLPVDPAILECVLQAANCAPSAGTLQAYEIFLVEDAAQRSALAEAARGQDFIHEAPIILVFCANPSRTEARYHERGVRLYAVQDATIACTFAMLAATDFGLGSVWVGAFDDQKVADALGNPKGLIPVAMLPLGYTDTKNVPTPRRALTDLVHHVGE